jgi:hypothetical protein
MLRFPLDGLLDEQACYDFLLHILHPDGLHCPQGHRCPQIKHPTDGGQSFLTSVAGSAVRSLTSLEPHTR